MPPSICIAAAAFVQASAACRTVIQDVLVFNVHVSTLLLNLQSDAETYCNSKCNKCSPAVIIGKQQRSIS